MTNDIIGRPVLPPEIEITGWGRYPASAARVFPVQSTAEPGQVLKARRGKSLLGRGAGRAYGDAALNRSNFCLDFTPYNRFIAFDEQTGILRAEAGVTLEQILGVFVPRGWFLPVTPGTKYPTLGGSVACDVHGKSSYSLSHYVERLHMLLADGSYVTCSAEYLPDLFWATVGGMGLTGLILEVELKMTRIETCLIKYQGVKARNLEEIFQLFEETEEWPMTVAWIDCLARGKKLGRSIMMRGAFARQNELKSIAQQSRARSVPNKGKLAVPFAFPAWSLNKLSVAAFNTCYYGKHPRCLDTIMDYDSFFYPLDSILKWNLIYGGPGLVQYQFLIPLEQGFEGVKTLLEEISATRRASFLAVLKKFGNIQNPGMISFPAPGYFLALDFPVGQGGILKHMDQWDKLVLKYGGRIYLAKDARMKQETFNAMYPRINEWRAVKQKYDPKNVFSSDLARRLGLEVKPGG